jgi:hypothetical protein
VANPHASSKPPALETDARAVLDKTVSAVATVLRATSVAVKSCADLNRPQAGGYNIS